MTIDFKAAEEALDELVVALSSEFIGTDPATVIRSSLSAAKARIEELEDQLNKFGRSSEYFHPNDPDDLKLVPVWRKPINAQHPSEFTLGDLRRARKLL
jgi:hypothetical protein